MADPRAVLTLLLILFIIFTPSGPNDPSAIPGRARDRLLEALTNERHNLDVLNSTKWGDFDPSALNGPPGSPVGRWINLTGFGRVEDGPDGKEQDHSGVFGWERLGNIKNRVREKMVYQTGDEGLEGTLSAIPNPQYDGVTNKDVGQYGWISKPFYKNISGVVHGDWVRSPVQEGIQAPTLNMSHYAPEGPFGPLEIHRFGRNLTEDMKKGWVKIAFEENDDESTLLSKVVGVEDDDKGSPVITKEVQLLREVRASINIGSEDTGDDWEAQVYGVHYLETGNMVLTTTSLKFAGIFALPHLTLSQYNYGLAQELLNRSVARTIHAHEEGLYHSLNPWSSAPQGEQAESEFSTPKCELVLYLQQNMVNLPESVVSSVESELRDPTGAFPPSPEDMSFSLLAFSPDCGYVLESKGPPDYAQQEGNHLRGLKVEVEMLRARHHVLVFFLVLFGQILLLTRQMRDASTPSTRSRVSFHTIAMLSLGDGFTTMAMCLTSLFVVPVWIPMVGSSFLAFMGGSLFGMKFLLDIYIVQAPERERAERARRDAAAAARAAYLAAHPPVNRAAPTTTAVATQATSLPTPIITAAGADTLPLPVTALRPPVTTEADVFIPSDQDITQPASPPLPPAADTLPTVNPAAQTTATTTTNTSRAPGFGALYTRFYFLLLATLFLSLNASSWPSTPRRVYFTSISFLYLSFWVPQITRNLQRNCRRALRWDFVAGQSLLRLIPFAYFYGYANNVLFADVDFVGLGMLVSWVWLQVLLLASQEVLGPRWFLVGPLAGREWVPPAYDYHPLLREDEEGGNLPIGAAEAFASADAEPPSPSTRKKSDAGGAGAEKAESKRKTGRGKRTFDCAICMGDLEVPVFEGDEGASDGAAAGGVLGGGAMVLERRRYMVTPCRHIFHSGCLEGWMKYRLQCPVCREELPPV